MPGRRRALGFSGASSTLAVCAHPDDESFGLGAVLHRLAAEGVRTSVLCLTHGEASTLGSSGADLREIRGAELRAAAEALGVERVELLDYPDGGLAEVPLEELSAEVARTVAAVGADLLLVFDEGGVTGHPDHCRATDAAMAASRTVPVLGWGLSGAVTTALNREFATTFVGRAEDAFDVVLRVDREVQRRAIACLTTQSTDNPVLRRRLELLSDTETLRWLRHPAAPDPEPPSPSVLTTRKPTPSSTKEPKVPGTVHVSHLGGDRFEIGV